MLETLSTTSPGQDLYQHVSCEICGIWNGRSLVLKVELHLANSPNLAINTVSWRWSQVTFPKTFMRALIYNKRGITPPVNHVKTIHLPKSAYYWHEYYLVKHPFGNTLLLQHSYILKREAHYLLHVLWDHSSTRNAVLWEGRNRWIGVCFEKGYAFGIWYKGHDFYK